MAITLQYEGFGEYKGEAGAWFKGKAYGYKKHKREFLSFDCIRKALGGNAILASRPEGVWTFSKLHKNGMLQEKAYAVTSDDLVRSLDGTVRETYALKFEKVATIDSGSAAQFTHNDKNRTLSFHDVNRHLAVNAKDAADPTKINFYFISAASGSILSGYELMKARTALAPGKIENPAGMKVQPSI